MADILKISKSSTENHLHQLGYVNRFDIWVPHKLSEKNLLDCISACDSLLFFGSIFKKLTNLFLAVLGLCCCGWAFSSCGERGLLFVVVRGLLIAVSSLVAEHGL